jgi:hypothetical protein
MKGPVPKQLPVFALQGRYLLNTLLALCSVITADSQNMHLLQWWQYVLVTRQFSDELLISQRVGLASGWDHIVVE